MERKYKKHVLYKRITKEMKKGKERETSYTKRGKVRVNIKIEREREG